LSSGVSEGARELEIHTGCRLLYSGPLSEQPMICVRALLLVSFNRVFHIKPGYWTRFTDDVSALTDIIFLMKLLKYGLSRMTKLC
jgi:hypothetical protein